MKLDNIWRCKCGAWSSRHHRKCILCKADRTETEPDYVDPEDETKELPILTKQEDPE